MKTSVLLGVLALASACAAEEEELNAAKDDEWAGRAIGTWVAWEWEVTSGGETSRGTEKETLKKVDGTKVTFQVDKASDGAESSEEETHDLPEPFKVEWREIGKETLEIDGTKIECRILLRQHKKSKGQTTSWRGKVDGKEIELKAVSHAEMTDGKVVDSSWRVAKLKEELSVGDRKLACQLTEGKDTTREGDKVTKSSSKTWTSPEIGGGVAKRESRDVEGDEETVTTWRVTAFGSPKKE